MKPTVMGEGLKRVDGRKGHAAIIHVGRKAPKALLALGYIETSAMHIGHGVWLVRLEKQVGAELRR